MSQFTNYAENKIADFIRDVVVKRLGKLDAAVQDKKALVDLALLVAALIGTSLHEIPAGEFFRFMRYSSRGSRFGMAPAGNGANQPTTPTTVSTTLAYYLPADAIGIVLHVGGLYIGGGV